VVRQVGNALRQALNLLAGDAIDALLLSRLRGLTSEFSVARALLSLHGALWPGGVWFAWANQQVGGRPRGSRWLLWVEV
jgi:hypothetical protein